MNIDFETFLDESKLCEDAYEYLDAYESKIIELLETGSIIIGDNYLFELTITKVNDE